MANGLVLAGLLITAARCSRQVNIPKHGQDIVIVRGQPARLAIRVRPPLPSLPFAKPSPDNGQDDEQPEQLAAIAAARDADPYRIADADLSGEAFDPGSL